MTTATQERERHICPNPLCRKPDRIRYRIYKTPHFHCDHCGHEWDEEKP